MGDFDFIEVCLLLVYLVLLRLSFGQIVNIFIIYLNIVMVHMSLGVMLGFLVASLGKSLGLCARTFPWLLLIVVLGFLTMLFRLFMRLFVLMLLRVVGWGLLGLWVLVLWLLGLLRLMRLLGLLSLFIISLSIFVRILRDIAPLVISGLAPGILSLLDLLLIWEHGDTGVRGSISRLKQLIDCLLWDVLFLITVVLFVVMGSSVEGKQGMRSRDLVGIIEHPFIDKGVRRNEVCGEQGEH